MASIRITAHHDFHLNRSAMVCVNAGHQNRKTIMDEQAGVAQLVELQPSKLNVASSSLVSRSTFCSAPGMTHELKSFENENFAHVAQSVERFLGKEEVHRFNSDRGLHPF
jgi:hypothetical protein